MTNKQNKQLYRETDRHRHTDHGTSVIIGRVIALSMQNNNNKYNDDSNYILAIRFIHGA